MYGFKQISDNHGDLSLSYESMHLQHIYDSGGFIFLLSSKEPKCLLSIIWKPELHLPIFPHLTLDILE